MRPDFALCSPEQWYCQTSSVGRPIGLPCIGERSEALQADDRRIAEAHYKLALTLHFLEDPEKALEHANKAVAVCSARIARLSEPEKATDSAAELSSEVSATR